MATRENGTIERAAARAGHYRWVVVGLLFAATVINYVERQMIGVPKPVLSDDLGWSETDFAQVIFWFQAAYAIGYIGFCRLVELLGARPRSCGALVLWQLPPFHPGRAIFVHHFAVPPLALPSGRGG